MGKMRCFLCGGRVANGVCTECGMPQQRHETNHDLNKNDCDGKTLPHVHEDKPQTAVRANASEQPQKSGEKSISSEPQKKKTIYMSDAELAERYKKEWTFRFRGLCVRIIIVAVGLTVFGISYAYKTGKLKIFEAGATEQQDLTEDIYIMDDYEYEHVMYEMPTDGEHYTNDSVAAGYYKVGYDIPEGTYTVSAEFGYGSLIIDDEDNGIHINRSLSSVEKEYGYDRIQNVMLYQGAEIRVEDSLELKFASENAQTDKLADKVPNELTQTVTLNGTAEAGKDFPAGVYDIYCAESWGDIDIYKQINDTEVHYYKQRQLLQSSEDAEKRGRMEAYALGFYNVNLEEGLTISLRGGHTEMELVPSETVVPEKEEGKKN